MPDEEKNNDAAEENEYQDENTIAKKDKPLFEDKPSKPKTPEIDNDSIEKKELSPEKKHEFDKDTMAFWFMAICVLIVSVAGMVDYFLINKDIAVFRDIFEFVKSLALIAAGYFFARSKK